MDDSPTKKPLRQSPTFYTMVALMAIFLGVRILHHIVTGHELPKVPNTILGLSLILIFATLRIRVLLRNRPE